VLFAGKHITAQKGSGNINKKGWIVIFGLKIIPLLLVVIGFTVFPLLGVLYFQTNGLLGGFGIGLVIALIVSFLKKD
jgi:hypothetical protein